MTERFGALAPIFGTLVTSFIAMLIAVPVGLMVAFFLTELCPKMLRRPIGIAIELLAGIPSIIYGIWGLFVFAPFLQQYVQPFFIDTFENVPVLSTLFAGPPYGIGMFTAGLILAIMVLPFVTSISRDVFDAVPPVLKEAAYGVGCTTWEVFRYVVLPFTRVGVIGGFMLGLGRALGETMAVTFVIGNAHHVSASLFAPGTTISASIANEFTEAVGDLYTSSLIALGLILFFITFIVLAIARYMLLRLQRQQANGNDMKRPHWHSPLYAAPCRRPQRASPPRRFALGRHDLRPGLAGPHPGRAALSRHRRPLALGVHREHAAAGRGGRPAQRDRRQPRDDRAGGGRSARRSASWPAPTSPSTAVTTSSRACVRFINDILLSAPSIVIGLFVYEIMVAPMGHFSGWAGAVALAVIVIPVVVRTTEDMLTLVPDTLREAAASIGLPRAHMIVRIAYRAAQAGIVTGILLAIARISGETAPLLFTALNNQFFSMNMNAPMPSLPVVIFQFALSPYAEWQKLAWTGALLITVTVLGLSILARSLTSSRKS